MHGFILQLADITMQIPLVGPHLLILSCVPCPHGLVHSDHSSQTRKINIIVICTFVRACVYACVYMRVCVRAHACMLPIIYCYPLMTMTTYDQIFYRHSCMNTALLQSCLVGMSYFNCGLHISLYLSNCNDRRKLILYENNDSYPVAMLLVPL